MALAEEEKQLVEAAANGNVESFTVLCRQYYCPMVAIAHALLGDGHLAEDIAQETFAKAFYQLPHLNDKDKFPGWLAAICRNTAKDTIRKRKNLQPLPDADLLPDRTLPDDRTQAARTAIRQLPADQRELIYLRYYDGMSYQQIAAILDISEEAINGRLRRARKEIADYLRRNDFIERSTYEPK